VQAPIGFRIAFTNRSKINTIYKKSVLTRYARYVSQVNNRGATMMSPNFNSQILFASHPVCKHNIPGNCTCINGTGAALLAASGGSVDE